MKRNSSYRSALVDGIRKCVPSGFFGQWAVRRGVLWTPQRLVWMAMLMAWSAEQTLADRFDAVGGLLSELFLHWKLGRTYTGFYDAMAVWSKPLQSALCKRLR